MVITCHLALAKLHRVVSFLHKKKRHREKRIPSLSLSRLTFICQTFGTANVAEHDGNQICLILDTRFFKPMWETSSVPFTPISFSSDSKSDTVSFGVVFICHKLLLSVSMTIRFNKNHDTFEAIPCLAIFSLCLSRNLFLLLMSRKRQYTGKFLS